jgi:rhodanese-related sulfurtransferase
MNDEPGTMNDEQRRSLHRSSFIGHRYEVFMQKSFIFVLLAFATFGCHTIGVSRTRSGFSEVAPQVAAEMILDSQQVVVLDVRPANSYRGPEGHIAGSLNTPFDSIERQLPELLPYQNQTVIVYGETSTDGAVAAKLLAVAGFRNIVHIDGGLKGWIDRGYRTVNSQE